ncbi:MAG TPA: PTS-dependent dihydroxyacetone kinase phosphotransferase subunit DhaM [Firmicutes bacterium]|nr:PTS-dependent dihydroxyacetone kinase phosphotransferase subunit DhaM [Bacillota bacterium]
MVGLVIVSHSASLARGIKELASQMAPKVPMAAVGGTSDGRLGTDANLIKQAIEQLAHCNGVLVLMDLGSAVLSTETALEYMPLEIEDKVQLADGPVVEGAVAAAVESSLGKPLAAVKAAAEAAAALKKL